MIRSLAVVCPGAHSAPFLRAIADGAARHGIVAKIVGPADSTSWADAVACWGWRQGRRYSEMHGPDRVLILERGYMTDAIGRDRFTWTSLGWGGLNGHARFTLPDDGGSRWRRCFDGCLAPPRAGGDCIVIMGQVPGDASIANVDLAAWYRRAADRLAETFSKPVLFRPHPKHRGAPWPVDIPLAEGDLDEVLARASLVAAYNSNSLTDAVMAGVHVLAGDCGAMAWPVAKYRGLEALDRPRTVNREAWAHRMAWTQWLPNELADGTAWSTAVHGRDAPAFHVRADTIGRLAA